MLSWIVSLSIQVISRQILQGCALAQVISRGMQHRRTGSHELNMESSRSHSIMTVYCNVAAEEADSGASLATMGKISFVDLVSPSMACLLDAECYTCRET